MSRLSSGHATFQESDAGPARHWRSFGNSRALPAAAPAPAAPAPAPAASDLASPALASAAVLPVTPPSCRHVLSRPASEVVFSADSANDSDERERWQNQMIFCKTTPAYRRTFREKRNPARLRMQQHIQTSTEQSGAAIAAATAAGGSQQNQAMARAYWARRVCRGTPESGSRRAPPRCAGLSSCTMCCAVKKRSS